MFELPRCHCLRLPLMPLLKGTEEKEHMPLHALRSGTVADWALNGIGEICL